MASPNASIVMAAFLHVAPGGMRFNGPELGAWYAADDIRTAAAEVGHHLRREAVARSVATMSRTYRAYTATLLGDYLDIRGQQATLPMCMRASAMTLRRSLARTFAHRAERGYSITACDVGLVSTSSRTDRATLRTSCRRITMKLRSQQHRARSTCDNYLNENHPAELNRTAYGGKYSMI